MVNKIMDEVELCAGYLSQRLDESETRLEANGISYIILLLTKG